MNGMDAVIGRPRWLVRMGQVLALLGLGWAAQHAAAQTSAPKKLVADVIVTGNRNVPTEMIKANLKTKPGKEYSLSEVESDARRLVGLGSFRDVRTREHATSDGQIVVEFIVFEHPNLIQEVKVLNARHLRTDQIETLQRIRTGAPLNYMLNKQAALEIEDHYRQKGYLLATCKLEEGADPGDKRVIFNVTEGPLVHIRSIRFTGNDSLASSARLKTQITSMQTILRLIGGVYNPAQIDHDVHKLEEYYRTNGYLDVKVSRELSFSPDYRWVDITFHIHEGVPYRVGDVTVAGVTNLPPEQVESILKTKKSQYYNGKDMDTDVRRIKDLYGWRGYKVPVRPELYYPEPGIVHVHYQVLDEPRPPAKVGKVLITGNRITKDRVIRNMLGIYPNQTLRYPELRIAEQNLIRRNIFENNPELGIRPTVTVIEDPNNPDAEYKDVLVRVEETYTGSFMLGLGVNSDAGLVGSIVLNERNFDLFRPPLSLSDIFEGKAFRGGGQEFRLEAVPGTELQRYTVSIREPFLFDQPYSLTWSAYYYDRLFREYTENRVGTRVTLGRQLNQFWSVSGGLRLENVRVSDVPFFAPQDFRDVEGDNFVVAPRFAVARDSRDSYLRPTEGSLIEASYEHVFGDFTYPILSLEANKYITVTQRRDGSGKHVLVARGQISWAGNDVPVYDRFYAGGYRSMRGFEFRGVGPFVNDFNIGGNFMILAGLEYQLPILASDNFYLVGFVDSGTVERDFEIRDYRVSVGLGARIIVPMMGPVPIALDFGFPITRGDGDREQVFSFNVGFFR